MAAIPKKPSLEVVRIALQGYADRGVFRGFSESKPGQFKFVWLLQHPMELQLDAAKQELRFKKLLPCVAARSALYSELKQVIEQRHDRALPEHRRVDRRRVAVACSNRSGFVSLTLTVKKNQFEYGVNRLVDLVHELFLHLCEYHPEYLMGNFNVPQE
ncbi:MAG: hypothetical protein HOP19_03015 [Acidobacteria bacterium]|nr:hypothetical protein [Acidobacteriota bacterium]